MQRAVADLLSTFNPEFPGWDNPWMEQSIAYRTNMTDVSKGPLTKIVVPKIDSLFPKLH